METYRSETSYVYNQAHSYYLDNEVKARCCYQTAVDSYDQSLYLDYNQNR